MTLINRILIIDDEIVFCEALKNHLSQKGSNVRIYNSYHEFQSEADVSQYDLILLDLHLRDIKGLELLQIVLDGHPDLKVVIISSYLDRKNISQAKKLGAYDCISKNSQMFKTLDQLLESI